MSKNAMVVAGVMSGTSADGIDVALVRIGEPSKPVSASGRRGRGRPRHMIRLLGHAAFPYPAKVRSAILAAMNAPRARVADLARLNSLLGELYADSVLAAQRRFRVKAHLVGCHGQTLYHQGKPQPFLGRAITTTWQTGEAAVIAARVGIPVVSDFRPADMAAGGKGAPLVPYLDYLWFRDAEVGRIVQNIGGIANLTAIPAAASAGSVTAFDTGPGNMVIDAVTAKLYKLDYDQGGKIAASGKVLDPVIQTILRRAFFRAKPPKTAGREEFGREFVREFLALCGRARKADIVATATALTARSIAESVERFLIAGEKNKFHEMIVSGGGAKNATLIRMLTENLAALGIRVRFSDEFGLPSEAKEAVAFAVLAYETWNRRPSNVPSATGAKRPAVLEKFHMRETAGVGRQASGDGRRTLPIKPFVFALFWCLLFPLLSCSSKPDANTVVMLIESSPTNLDPRVGLDAQSARIDALIFDGLVARGGNLNVVPDLAERWEIPDPLTYIFHLHHGVRFHDGRALTARDVKWTLDSLMQGKVRSTKASNYRFVDHIDATDDFTVTFHMKEPDSPLLWNLADAALGIVPYGSGDEMTQHPIGSGPFKFVSAETDREVILERNDDYWGDKAKLARVRFAVVPDETTEALELRKGSGDIAINSLTPDTVVTLARDKNLAVERGSGTRLAYLGFNLRDPILKDVRVRQAIAYGLDRRPMIEYLWCGEAELASSILPKQSWAYNPDVPTYPHDPEKAKQLLDAAGYPAVNGVRFHITMKTSTDANTRLMVAVMQQQLREVGIALEIRSFEFATFFSDVQHGAFQMYGLRWIGGNEDPDIFEYAFHSSKFPPNGANRSYYSNPKIDALIDKARREIDPNVRKPLYAEVQRIVAEDLPYVNFWYLDNVAVHTTRVRNLKLNPAGNFDFLRTAELALSSN